MSIIIRLLVFFNFCLRKTVTYTHALQHQLQWKRSTTPEWYDHYLDQYFSWPYRQVPFWLERGVFSLLAVQPKAKVLELCCGDGFNSRYFYSHRAQSILSMDFDKTAIHHAQAYNHTPNVTFQLGDIRSQFPNTQFDNVIWDAAIEHFTETEIQDIMKKIKNCLGSSGILSGHTIVESEDGHKQLHQHEYEFKSKEDLLRFLSPWFKNVRVFETKYPERHNLYFYASNGTIPFDGSWTAQLTSNS